MNETELLQSFLADRDTPCPLCKYNLRDLTSAKCPECGELVTLRVGLVEPKLGAWIAGVIGLSVGVGFFWVFAIIMTIVGDFETSVMLWGFGLPLAGVLYFWMTRARKVRQWPRKRQAWAAIGCWSVTAVVVAFLVVVTT